ncbi:hypothetical protein C8R43DRAFT_1122707 [Mycena crocata]|nr:hypothetical protein C8R43DRAFT_1122707 [Mycena crocata]
MVAEGVLGIWSLGAAVARGIGALRIEWAKAYARSRRWKEEVKLLEEESRRVEVSFEWMAYVWEQRAQAIQVGSLSATVAEGAIAYAVRQSRMFRDLKERAHITFTEPKLVNGKKRGRAPRAPSDGLGDGGDSDDGDDEEDSDDQGWDSDEGEEEQGNVASDEELFLGGEDEED